MLRIDNLEVAYGKAVALHDVSLQVNDGELVALLGSNGAGKSTLLKTISGVIRPRKGGIFWNEQAIHTLPSHKIVSLGIVQVPEGRAVFPDLTVSENLMMGSFTRQNDGAVTKDMALIFDLFPRLEERRKQNAGTLSGGEAQMLAIARGLLSAPELLMLDEPSLGIAPVIRDNIFKVIGQVFEERGITILLVEQNAKLALNMSSRGYILENGKVSLEGKGSDLIDNDYVKRSYLGY
ncbi:MAG: ABC transporter ATP-binding protein [Deltaproteobacteria bacterium]|nr:ABC transporter ATP-binding protein [Deltaproteobacteria bacterium]